MEGHFGQSTPVWIGTPTAIPENPLPRDIESDVCVIGAGIAGLSAAYMLALEGKRVVVLDDGPIGGGESGRTTAHLSVVLDRRYHQIERLHGASGARIAAASHRAATDCRHGRSHGSAPKRECDQETADVRDQDLKGLHSGRTIPVHRCAVRR